MNFWLNFKNAQQNRPYIPGSMVFLFVLLTYIWFISVGTWTYWPSYTDYYDKLATAFQQGHTYLDISPSAELLTLSNPYDPQARLNIDYPDDASLYKGKFYLYWGPVPSLLLAMIKVFSHINVYDQYFVFVFSVGTFIFNSLLIYSIKKRFFYQMSNWEFIAGIALVGWVGPFTWLLNSPTIYEAATLGGQFFFAGGFYFTYRGLEDDLSPSKLVLAGIFLSCAVGTRVIQIFPALLLVAVSLASIWKKFTHRELISKAIVPILALLAPLTVSALGLAWYNYIRFDSIFEFGFNYSLAGPDLQTYRDVLFSPIYLFQNLHHYVFQSFKITNRFPIISPVFGAVDSLLPYYHLPTIYFAEKITGLLYSGPVFLLSLVPVYRFSLKRKYPISDGSIVNNDEILYKVTIGSLIGSFLLSFLPVLAFFWAAPRYICDFINPLLILTVIGLWHIDSSSVTRLFRYAAIFVSNLLLYYSIIVTTILAFTSHIGRFSAYNPELLAIIKLVVQYLRQKIS